MDERIAAFKAYLAEVESKGGGDTVPEFPAGATWFNAPPLKLGRCACCKHGDVSAHRCLYELHALMCCSTLTVCVISACIQAKLCSNGQHHRPGCMHTAMVRS